MKCIHILFGVLALAISAHGQVSNPSIIPVASDPTGLACTGGLPNEQYQGNQFTCINGVWAKLFNIPNCPTGLIYSQCPSNLTLTGWAFNNSSGVARGYFAPDGTTNALLMTEDSTSNEHYDITGPVSYSWAAGSTHTYTLYAKRVVGIRNMQMQISLDGFTNTASIGISLSNCSTVFGPNIGGDVTATGSATPIFPNWCKITLNATASGSHTTYYLDFSLISGSTKVYTGDGTSTNAYWGLTLQ